MHFMGLCSKYENNCKFNAISQVILANMYMVFRIRRHMSGWSEAISNPCIVLRLSVNKEACNWLLIGCHQCDK